MLLNFYPHNALPLGFDFDSIICSDLFYTMAFLLQDVLTTPSFFLA